MTEREAGTRRGAAARVGARSAVALVGIAVGAAIIAAAGLIPWPQIGVQPLSAVVTPVPLTQQVVCPGAALRLGSTTGQDADTATSLGAPTTATAPASASGSVLAGPGQPSVFSLPGEATVAAAQIQSLTGGDFSGLSAAACTTPSSDAWLVGGATTTGRTTLITLANPSAVDATVNLGIYTEKGEISAPGARGIVVAAGHQQVLSLAGLAPDAVAPVVHVTSTGGLVAAALQVSISRGLLPSGTETVGPTSGPAEHLVIPGLTVVAADDSADNVANRISQDSSGESDLSTVLRLYAPGAGAAVTVTIVAEGGDPRQGATVTASVPAGQVTEVPLDGLQTGAYTVTVSSDQEVVGALRASVAATPTPQANSTDLAWWPVPSSLAVPTTVVVPSGPGIRLHVANDGNSAATVRVGSTATLAVPAHASAGIVLAAGSYAVTPSSPVSATLTYSSTTQLAAAAVQPRAADADPVTVWPNP